MSKENSFDIVSKIEMQEIDNTVNQTLSEVKTRYDFKGTKTEIKLEDETLMIISDDEYRLNSVTDILMQKAHKRGISPKAFDLGKIENASGNTVRQKVKLRQGVDAENAKKINIAIRDSKIKVKTQIQGDQIRVSGKDRDELQSIIQLIRSLDLPIELQFINFR